MKRYFFIFLALFLFLPYFIAYANPNQKSKGTVRSVHDSWSIFCEIPFNGASEQCAMVQNVAGENNPEITLSVAIIRSSNKKEELLRILAPLGLFLPNGLGLKIDNKDMGRVDFVRCFHNGCYAEVVLEKKLLQTFKTGKSAAFIVFPTPETGALFSVNLSGFEKAFFALP